MIKYTLSLFMIIYCGIFVCLQHKSLFSPFLSKEKIEQTLQDPITYNLASKCDYSISDEDLKNYCSALAQRLDDLKQSSFLFLRSGDLVYYLYFQRINNITKKQAAETNERVSCLATGKCS